MKAKLQISDRKIDKLINSNQGKVISTKDKELMREMEGPKQMMQQLKLRARSKSKMGRRSKSRKPARTVRVTAAPPTDESINVNLPIK